MLTECARRSAWQTMFSAQVGGGSRLFSRELQVVASSIF
jgi:hypothetical protein